MTITHIADQVWALIQNPAIHDLDDLIAVSSLLGIEKSSSKRVLVTAITKWRYGIPNN